MLKELKFGLNLLLFSMLLYISNFFVRGAI
nr:MAG TPA: hypothetical protein [Caudoviricetes sp.]